MLVKPSKDPTAMATPLYFRYSNHGEVESTTKPSPMETDREILVACYFMLKSLGHIVMNHYIHSSKYKKNGVVASTL